MEQNLVVLREDEMMVKSARITTPWATIRWVLKAKVRRKQKSGCGLKVIQTAPSQDTAAKVGRGSHGAVLVRAKP